MLDSLYTAQTGLKTSQYAIDVTSNNIANESTEGYKKRVVETSEMSSLESEIGNGVSFDGVSRTTDSYLYSKILDQNSLSSYYSQQDTTLSNAEIVFSETEDSGFSTTLSDFFSSIESLRGDPTSSTYASEVETQAETLVNSIQSIYSDLEDIQEDNKDLLYDQVDEVNSILEQITAINEKIQQSGETNDLLDKRDALEADLSDYVDIDVTNENDNYTLSIAGETAIFNNTNVYEVSVDEEYIQQKDIYNTTDLDDSSVSDGETVTITLNNTTTLTLSASTSGASDNELKQQIVDAINNSSDFNDVEAYLDSSNNLIIKSVEGGEDNAFDIEIDVSGTEIEKSDRSVEAADNISIAIYNNDLDLTGGSLKSLSESLTTETSEISSYMQALDDFANALSEAYSDGTSTALFTGSSVSTLNYVEGSVDDLTASDIETIAQVQWDEDINVDSTSDETTSLSDFYSDLLVTVSSDVEDNASMQDTQDSVLDSLQTTYSNLTSVDTDEEMVNLLQYQAAYEANAKVITVVDEMLDTLLNM